MSKRDERIYLLHIMECIEAIERFTRNNREVFLSDEVVQNAVLRKLQIMAESTTRLNTVVKDTIPDVNWKALAGFRNILVHDYLGGVDLFLVWEHIEKRIPVLKKSLQTLLSD